MADIKLQVKNKHVSAEGAPSIVCGNSDYTLHIDFDEEWAEYANKTARFSFTLAGKKEHIDRPFNGNTVNAPPLADTLSVRVGFFAGDLRTTTPAVIPCEPSIRCGTGAPADPEPSVYDEIMELIKSGGGGGTGPQGPQGPQGEPGPQGPQGEPGPAGHTPQKGEDYFTPADIEAIVEQVLQQVTDGNEVSY